MWEIRAKAVKQEPVTSAEMTAGKPAATTPTSQVIFSVQKFKISFTYASAAVFSVKTPCGSPGCK